jgi:hypothetical protein
MEQWKSLNRLPGYEVSNIGRVRSLKRKKEKLLNQCVTKDGYHLVCLFNDGKRHTSYIHRLVAEAFLECKSHLVMKNAVVNHKDKNPSNNNVENLEWVSPAENMFHKADPITYFYFSEIENLCKTMDIQQLKEFVEFGKGLVQ